MKREELYSEWDNLTNLERNAWVAKDVMGWEVISEHEDLKRKQSSDYKEGYGIVALYGNHYTARTRGRSFQWNPVAEISAAWKMEEKVMGSHRIRYAYALAEVLANSRINNPDALDHFVTAWSDNLLAMIHATPEQRCKAALLAVLEEEETT